MKSTLTGIPHFQAHLNREMDAIVFNCSVIILNFYYKLSETKQNMGQYLDGFKILKNVGRNKGFTQRSHSFESTIALNGHNPRQNGDFNSHSSKSVQPVQVQVDVVKELRNNVVCPSIDFILEPSQIVIQVWILGVPLGVSCNSNTKVVSILLPNVSDQVGGIGEPRVDFCPCFLPTRRISSESQDILNPGLVGFNKCSINLCSRHIGASEMHARLEAVYCLGRSTESECQVGRCSTGAPSHINEFWAKSVHPFLCYYVSGGLLEGQKKAMYHAVIEVRDSSVSLWWKVLKGLEECTENELQKRLDRETNEHTQKHRCSAGSEMTQREFPFNAFPYNSNAKQLTVGQRNLF